MNAKQTISEVTGIKPVEIDSILAEIKANAARMENCPRHDFSIMIDRHTKQPVENPTPAQRFGAKFKCARCGGVVDNLARIWYEKGLKDALTV